MTEALFLLIAVFIAIFVIFPIHNARSRSARFSKNNVNHRATELQERKEAIYEAIKDIEFDYQMGKLSEADFKELRQEYKNQAIDLLKKIDQTQHKKGKHRRGKTKNKGVSAAAGHCTSCGAPVTKEDRFCGNCGMKLTEDQK